MLYSTERLSPMSTLPSNEAQISGPSWDVSTEYPTLSSHELAADIETVVKATAEIKVLCEPLKPWLALPAPFSAEDQRRFLVLAQRAFARLEDAETLLSNADTYVMCELSVDGKNDLAKTIRSKVAMIAAQLEQAAKPLSLFLDLVPDEFVEEFLRDARTQALRFSLMQSRKIRDEILPLEQEDTIIGLGVDGHSAWGTLYGNIGSSLSCTIDLPDGKKTMGLAAAEAFYQSHHEETRRAAYQAINGAWATQQESCAAMLNAIAGWRLEIYRRRSRQRRVHFLDNPLHHVRISKQTLDSMMQAVMAKQDIGRKACLLRAKALGKQQLGPWDLFAPCPTQEKGERTSSSPIEFGAAITLIRDAFSTVDPQMGDFVQMMVDNQWVEGRVNNNKMPGAYCTDFHKSRQPRVYMTYTGGMREVTTLAHELGHAFHAWMMRDMPLAETRYPMTLAETASIFGETVVNSALAAKAQNPSEMLKVSWSDAKEAEAFLCNIPARFTFEKKFYERRAQANLTVAEIKMEMVEAWKQSYGSGLSEMNDMFWASKLHFYITDMSFYNFPYTFGYLFALGVYAQRERLGKDFFSSYVDLLRDTGRMTAEEVAAKHLQVDLRQPEFWLQSLGMVEKKMQHFAGLLGG